MINKKLATVGDDADSKNKIHYVWSMARKLGPRVFCVRKILLNFNPR